MFSESRFVGLAFYAIVAFLVAILLVGTVPLFSANRNFFAEDQGLTFAVASRIFHGEIPLLGPPSHVGGRHFGPLLYIVTAIVMGISGGSTEVSVYLFGLLTILTALGCVWFSRALITPQYQRAAFLGALFAVCVGDYRGLAQLAWQSNFLFTPALIFLVSAHAALRGKDGSAWLLMFCSSLLLQAHFSAAPLLVGVGGVTLLHSLCINRNTFRLTTLAAFGIFGTIIIWIPAIWYQIAFNNNIAAVWHALHREKVAAGAHQAYLALRHFIFDYSVGRAGPDYLWHCGLRFFHKLFFPLSCLLSAFAIVRTFFNLDSSPVILLREGRLLLLGLSIASGIYVILLSREEPPLYNYYLNGLLVLPPLLMGIIFAQAAAFFERWWQIRGRQVFTIAALGSFCSLVLLGLLLIAAYHTAIRIPRSQSNLARFNTLAHVQEISQLINEETTRAGHTNSHFFARGISDVMSGAVNYYRGPASYNQIHYADWILEMPVFRKAEGSESDLGYLEICPRVDRSKRVEIWKEFAESWTYVRHLDLARCQTCGLCSVVEMQRRKPTHSSTASSTNPELTIH